jgi:hypothetical protein
LGVLTVFAFIKPLFAFFVRHFMQGLHSLRGDREGTTEFNCSCREQRVCHPYRVYVLAWVKVSSTLTNENFSLH